MEKRVGSALRAQAHHLPERRLNEMRMMGDELADNALEAFFERYPQLLTCQADGFVTALKLETKYGRIYQDMRRTK